MLLREFWRAIEIQICTHALVLKVQNLDKQEEVRLLLHIVYSPVQATSRQMWTVINFFLTVVGGFMFGFFVAYYAGFGIPAVS